MTRNPQGRRSARAMTLPERQRDQRRSTERYGRGWGAISRRILRRDHFVCQLHLPGCDVIATTVDHVIARANGGLTTEANLVAACTHCTRPQGARTA
jgi:5-methylcytosine-specific restriction endonuclease McrA